MPLNKALLFLILQKIFLNPYYFYSCLLQKVQRCAIRIALLVDDFDNAGIDHHLGAEDAGLVGAVKRCPFDADAVQRRLDDGVLLGVHRPAQLVAGAGGHAIPCAAHVVAVIQARRSAVVAGAENAFVLDKERTNLIAQAGGDRYL